MFCLVRVIVGLNIDVSDFRELLGVRARAVGWGVRAVRRRSLGSTVSFRILLAEGIMYYKEFADFQGFGYV